MFPRLIFVHFVRFLAALFSISKRGILISFAGFEQPFPKLVQAIKLVFPGKSLFRFIMLVRSGGGMTKRLG